MTITARSAYPPDVADLLPKARDLASDLGFIPSRNRLKTDLRVGAPKAKAVRDQLVAEAEGTGQTEEPDPDPIEPDDQEQGALQPEPTSEATPSADLGVATLPAPARPLSPWPMFLIAAPAFVAIWVGWVGLGSLTGFGPVHPLPGIADDFTINSAITLPVGMEAYAAYALRVWLTPGLSPQARRFAGVSAAGALALGMAGQAAYHLMVAAGMTAAPWQITTFVSCLPVAVAGMGAALARLVSRGDAR